MDAETCHRSTLAAGLYYGARFCDLSDVANRHWHQVRGYITITVMLKELQLEHPTDTRPQKKIKSSPRLRIADLPSHPLTMATHRDRSHTLRDSDVLVVRRDRQDPEGSRCP